MAVIMQSTDMSRQIRRAMKTLMGRKQALLALQKVMQQQNRALPASISEKRPLSLSIPSTQASTPYSLQSPLSPIIITSADRTVRVCQISEYKEVALSLAHAFADDPCAMFFINTPDRAHWTPLQKWNLHVEIMEYMVYAHMLDGIVTTVGEDYGAVALWMPPGKDMDSYSTTLRSGLWRLHYRLSRVGHARFFTDFMPLLHDTKHNVLQDRDSNSWYLVYLGTRPGARRRGLARALVEDVMVQADEQGVPVYLESSKAMNVPIYSKFGFVCKARIQMGERVAGTERVPLDIMVREPKCE